MYHIPDNIAAVKILTSMVKRIQSPILSIGFFIKK
ncbi:hypothetical protein vBEcoMWL3_gp112 [Escherichia phage vB_EcoM_WL-3]|nr:hypothetical protein vBEcoMWL3_gp112 [Escherichia phage vB_EcoM_WL-3]